MPNKSGARGIHTAAAKGMFIIYLRFTPLGVVKTFFSILCT